MKPYFTTGNITIYNMDCREVLPHVQADLLVTDPPYGISWKGPIHDGIVGDDSTEVRDWVLEYWGQDRAAIVFGSPLIQPPSGVKQVLVWVKPANLGLFGAVGGWRRDWEAIYLLGPWGSRSASGAPRSGVIKTNCSSAEYLNGQHPHAKPVELLTNLIESSTTQGTILDPFMGSGSTLRAAQTLGRSAVGIEIEERYCEMAAKRLADAVLPITRPVERKAQAEISPLVRKARRVKNQVAVHENSWLRKRRRR